LVDVNTFNSSACKHELTLTISNSTGWSIFKANIIIIKQHCKIKPLYFALTSECLVVSQIVWIAMIIAV